MVLRLLCCLLPRQGTLPLPFLLKAEHTAADKRIQEAVRLEAEGGSEPRRRRLREATRADQRGAHGSGRLRGLGKRARIKKAAALPEAEGGGADGGGGGAVLSRRRRSEGVARHGGDSGRTGGGGSRAGTRWRGKMGPTEISPKYHLLETIVFLE